MLYVPDSVFPTLINIDKTHRSVFSYYLMSSHDIYIRCMIFFTSSNASIFLIKRTWNCYTHTNTIRTYVDKHRKKRLSGLLFHVLML